MQVPDSGDLYMTDPETSRADGGRHFCRFPCKAGIAARLAVNDDDARIHPLADIVPNFNFNPQELGTQLPSSFLMPEVRSSRETYPGFYRCSSPLCDGFLTAVGPKKGQCF